MRMLAYGLVADIVDNHVSSDESIAIESLKRFVKAIIGVFGDEYLRSPNNAFVARLLAEGESYGFPGMLGSIDCMHWKWKNCPVAWKDIMIACIIMHNMIVEDEYGVHMPNNNYEIQNLCTCGNYSTLSATDFYHFARFPPRGIGITQHLDSLNL
ncbi:hypothetical protein L1049_007927 [Liquidambar formosana]|uniref:Nuclease HARBI1 n=1 Tax=Liquidambar formosana TaxID=63359 RepID=A0AAP0S5M4_LIQFO